MGILQSSLALNGPFSIMISPSFGTLVLVFCECVHDVSRSTQQLLAFSTLKLLPGLNASTDGINLASSRRDRLLRGWALLTVKMRSLMISHHPREWLPEKSGNRKLPIGI